MRTNVSIAALLLLAVGAMPPARADLYSAAEAVEKQDFARAFELYREVAELGRLEGQENLAVSYVNGEGVKRDNVLGYGWAVIARENGGGAEMQKIIDLIEPHLKEGARRRVAELQAQFGQEALKKNVLPVMRSGPPYAEAGCAFASPANPDNFYPPGALKQNISGSVFVEFTVSADGRAHHPRVIYGMPAIVFDEAGLAVVRSSTFKPKIENGVAVPCTMRIRVKFERLPGVQPLESADFEERIVATKEKAAAGDPNSQLLYGLILVGRPELNTKQERSGEWFLKAAQAGLPAAQFMVGQYVIGGYVFEPDERKGAAWLTRAAAAGQADAQLALANYLMRAKGGADVAAAIGWLEKASAEGKRDATYHLAALLATGPDAARRDPQRALDLLAKVMDAVDTDPTAYEIRAAAKAALGNFDEAVKDQRRAVTVARRMGWDGVPQKARLENYEKNVAWSGDLFAW